MNTARLHPALSEPKRIVSWWLRFEDLNHPNVDGLDRIKRRAEAMAKASVTTAMIFGAHFRWDFLPYFTLLSDHLATVAEELKKVGVELYDHHSVNLVHRYSTREEMRHVMLHSGPHLPLAPSREAAASWCYHGARLNDWRMIDVKTRDTLYFPQYAAEGFCFRNPAFIEAYRDYLKNLIRDTGITGISADDPVHFMHYHSCACPHCRAELKNRTGIDLPPIEDRTFWGNFENPAWKEWIDLRFDGARDFFRAISPVFPEGFRVTTCGHNSASPNSNGNAADARNFLLGGCNYTNLEMSGNTPPYKHDPLTNNRSVASNIINASHHLAAAREQGGRCFATGFGFTKETAGIVWAVNKMMGADCWFSTLKDRLGLPDHILRTLPNEADIIGTAFTFEKDHPALFEGTPIGQVGVYFSYETRKHTFFGNLDKGYYLDYSRTLNTLFRLGLSPHTVFTFPASPDEYPVILLPSAAAMTKEEEAAMRRYLASGGTVFASGPCAIASCHSPWHLPTAPTLDDPKDFFSYILGGVKHMPAKWTKDTVIPPVTEEGGRRAIETGLFYHPARISDLPESEDLTDLLRPYLRASDTEILQATGFLVSLFETDTATVAHFLAEDYDTDIDHTLDEMRFHRSRVNYINRVTPIGTTDTLRIRCKTAPTVYLPFSEESATVTRKDGIAEILLPKETTYCILCFPKS